MSFQPTQEQQEIIDFALTGNDLIVQAYAGCGKSSTLALVGKALQTQNKRGIYLAFNKDVANDAKNKMSSNVECSTVHSLAYRNTDKKLIAKLKYRNIYPSQSADRYGIEFLDTNVQLPLGDIEDKKFSPTQILTMAKNTVKNYCNSADDEITLDHVKLIDMGHTSIIQGEGELIKQVFKYAKMHWKDIINHKSETPLTHDAYLKLYSMSECNLNIDFIMADEFQDVNPCILNILEKQSCQKLLVGDSFQSIYQWRGAINAMELFDYKQLYLTKTFRFGNQMSVLANLILSLQNADKPLIDNGDGVNKIYPKVFDCYIYRTNQGALEKYIQLLNDGVRPYLNVNVDEIKQFIQHYFGLDKGWDIKRPHPLLTGFNKTRDVLEYLEENDDRDLAKFVKLCINNGYGLIHKLDNMPDIDTADCILMTAHKSKGLEYNTVFIGDDFNLTEDDELGTVPTINEMELNLAYVAVTRAKKYIDCSGMAGFFDLINYDGVEVVVS